MKKRSQELIGTSDLMQELRAEIGRVAASDAKVLITGESGVGKELVAIAIHQQSARAQGPFIALNCASIPETLLESELFGHERGSFTGAYRDKPGKLELADGGSIFLDEMGEMTLRMQGLLLRFLETGDLQKVGSHRVSRHVNVRVIAATNRNLVDLIQRGLFREDLFYRLNVIDIVVPSLRRRREDIPALIGHFLEQLRQPADSPLREISTEALTILIDYAWPGNVRQLENVIERVSVQGRGETISAADLPPEIRAQSGALRARRQERRRTVSDELYRRLTEQGESFWTAVYPLYMQREITRDNVRDLIRKGLQDSRGNYKIVARMFNLGPTDYKRFLNFLRKHECRLPFKEYR